MDANYKPPRIVYTPGSIKYWQAKYERYLLATRSARTAYRWCTALENFLSRYRDRKTPDEISLMDVNDYRADRLKEGIESTTVDIEIDAIRAFYNWLTDVQDVPTFNPAAKFRKRESVPV